MVDSFVPKCAAQFLMLFLIFDLFCALITQQQQQRFPLPPSTTLAATLLVTPINLASNAQREKLAQTSSLNWSVIASPSWGDDDDERRLRMTTNPSPPPPKITVCKFGLWELYLLLFQDATANIVRSQLSWCDGGLNNGKKDLRRRTPLLLP